MCVAAFAAGLALWMWYDLPLERASRQDPEAERDSALLLIKELEARNLELQILEDKTREDRDAYRNEFGRLNTEIIRQANTIAQLESRPDVQAELDSTIDELHQSYERCRDLENKDSERKALSAQLQRANRKIEKLEASLNRAKIVAPELTRLENTRDQASQGGQAKGSKARIEELEAALKAADKGKGRELENTRNQLAGTNEQQARRVAELERDNAQLRQEHQSQLKTINALRESVDEQNTTMSVDVAHECDHSRCINEVNLRNAKIADMDASLMNSRLQYERLQATSEEQGRRLQDREAANGRLLELVGASERSWSQLRGSLQLGEEHDFGSVQLLLCQWQANAASQGANQAHQCDHSACLRQIQADSNEIAGLRSEKSSLAAKVDNKEQQITAAKTEGQKAFRRANQATKVAKDQLEAAQRDLVVEKAGRQAAVDAERRIARERFDATNPLREVVAGLKKELEVRTAERDNSRANNEAFRRETAKSRAKVEEGEGQQVMVERQRDDLVKAVGELHGRMAGMVEVDREGEMEGVDDGTVSKKRQNNGEGDARPAKILRDE